MSLLEIRDVTRRFGALEAVKDVMLSIEVGDPVAVCWRHDAGVFLYP
jgi:ABC-type branched-subunit amino acid transport system ATPase component